MASSTSLPCVHNGFRRQLVLMAILGTFVPLAVLALLYALAPLPMTPATITVLRTANGVAAVLVGMNALAIAVLVLARTLFQRKLGHPAEWQPVQMTRGETA